MPRPRGERPQARTSVADRVTAPASRTNLVALLVAAALGIARPAHPATLPPSSRVWCYGLRNPFRIARALELALESRVEFEVYDLAGRAIWRAPARDVASGRAELLWPGVTASGTPARPGVYLASVRTAGVTAVRRFVIVR